MAIPARPAHPDVRRVEIGPDRAGQRLDNFLLSVLKGVPRSHVYRLLRRGEVRVNSGRVKPEYRLKAGDSVRIPPVRTAIPEKRLADGESFAWLAERILYEDEHLLVMDKPPGLAVHGGSGVTVGLIEALRALRPDEPGLELAHRLDRATSGCLIIAKTRQALAGLHRQLREGEIRKHYLALVMGAWRGGPRTVSASLARGKYAPGERHVRVDDEGKESASEFSPKHRFAGMTLVEVALLTGRTHQARVHAAHLGQPIAGDDKYGDYDFNRRLRRLGLKRLFLHAARLRFQHPITGAGLELTSPVPPDLEAVLTRLKNEARA